MNVAVLYAIAAGFCVAIIAPMNAGLQGKLGIWGMNAFVHLVGLVFCLPIFFITSKQLITSAANPPWYSYLGGIFGALIVVLMVLGITKIGVSSTLVLTIASQLLLAALIDYFGLLGQERSSLSFIQIIGLAIVCLGAYLVIAKPSLGVLSQQGTVVQTTPYSGKAKHQP